MSSILSLATLVLTPFASNGNTGNCYEIFTYLEDLRKMGLTNADLDSLTPLFEKILATNTKSKADQKIKSAIESTKSTPVGNGLFINGKKVISMKNVTQDDSYGDTADKIYILEDHTELGESIFGKTTRNDIDSLTKCISNPTCKRFGCGDSQITRFNSIAADAVTAFKNEMTALYGADETKWPSRVKSKAAVDAQSAVASITAELFNALPETERCERMENLLKYKSSALPANILRVVNTSCSSSVSYLLVAKDVTKSNPTLKANGVFLKMYLDDVEIGSTQVKFNNGVYHNGKTSSICSSWNATAYLTKIFTLVPIV